MHSRRTRRLIIRPYLDSDYPAWRAGFAGRAPAQNEYDSGPPPEGKVSKSEFRKRMRTYRECQAKDLIYYFGLFERKTGANVGAIDLTVICRARLQCANLGYLIHNQHQGHGYASEASRAVVDIAFRELGLYRIEAGMLPDHRASRRVACSIGMKPEGIRRAAFYETPGGWEDCFIYAITARDRRLGSGEPKRCFTKQEMLARLKSPKRAVRQKGKAKHA